MLEERGGKGKYAKRPPKMQICSSDFKFRDQDLAGNFCDTRNRHTVLLQPRCHKAIKILPPFFSQAGIRRILRILSKTSISSSKFIFQAHAIKHGTLHPLYILLSNNFWSSHLCLYKFSNSIGSCVQGYICIALL